MASTNMQEQLAYVQEAEKLGVHSVWTVEGWGYDAVTPLAFLAGHTNRIKLGTSIMQICARTPANIAMTALSLANLSENRFLLGLGNSGPQIVEGLHGVSFEKPLTRMRETVEIIRMAFAGEKIDFSGIQHQLPLPGGQGRTIRLSEGPNLAIPIYLATLGAKSLRFTGEAADGWIGTSFTPEYGDNLLDDIRLGASEARRELKNFDIHVGAVAVSFSEDVDALVESERMGRAFTIGAMGSKDTNFYYDAYRRGGWQDVADRVQHLWLSGDRSGAAAAVPTEMILRTNLFGAKESIRERLREYEAAGVTTLKVQPKAKNLDDRLDILGRLMDLL
ncbi:MAG: LLM class flavin-dependent oxidoreductase [Pseudomonadota bacterium]|nr:LLM class flavin-dependent oxidoreductase [Pseudomonadota bacterium]